MRHVTVGSASKTIAVRLQGGLGDHILGMRVLSFIRTRYPHHDIIIYSDSGGYDPQLQIAAMSPFASRVVPVYESLRPATNDEVGRIANLRPEDQALIRGSDCFIDAFGRGMFAAASSVLDVPIVDILAQRPQLEIPNSAGEHANSIVDQWNGRPIVGLNLTKWGADVITKYQPRIVQILDCILSHTDALVLNIFPSSYEYGNWHEPQRTMRREQSRREAHCLMDLCQLDRRILPCVDLPLATVAALIKRAHYFIGVDNGIKHLAWALNTPLTFFHPKKPSISYVLRWMPDLNRLLLFDCSDSELRLYTSRIISALSGGAVRL